MIPILLLDLMVSALPCRVSRGRSVRNLFHQGPDASASRRIPRSSRPSAPTRLANVAISGCRPDLLSTTPQPQTAIQNA
jgi:hypothetical protein